MSSLNLNLPDRLILIKIPFRRDVRLRLGHIDELMPALNDRLPDPVRQHLLDCWGDLSTFDGHIWQAYVEAQCREDEIAGGALYGVEGANDALAA